MILKAKPKDNHNQLSLIIKFIKKILERLEYYLFSGSYPYEIKIMKRITDEALKRPRKNRIRRLCGKRAREYRESWEKTNTYLEVGDIKKFFYGIRYIFYQLAGLRIHYWIKRPWCNAQSRREIDILSIRKHEDPEEQKDEIGSPFFAKMRYIHLKHKYKKDLARKENWIMVKGGAIRPLYIWSEDIKKYYKITKKPKTKK